MIFADRASSDTFNAKLYSVTNTKTILDLTLSSLPSNHRCCGSSRGWLAFQRTSIIFYLYNPFSFEKIELPSLNFDVYKVILSKNPSLDACNFEAAAMSSGTWGENKLAILKPGSKAWIFASLPGCPLGDMIYYDERYCIVAYNGAVLSIDNTTLKYKEIAPQSIRYSHFRELYLVETTTNELLRVEITHPRDNPLSVRIYMLVTSPTTQESMFAELYNLGDEALFLCNHVSMSVLASKFSGCKSNSICYVDRFCYMDQYHSHLKLLSYCVRLIHLQDGSLHTQFAFNVPVHDADNTMPPPSWIIPTPKFTTFKTVKGSVTIAVDHEFPAIRK